MQGYFNQILMNVLHSVVESDIYLNTVLQQQFYRSRALLLLLYIYLTAMLTSYLSDFI